MSHKNWRRTFAGGLLMVEAIIYLLAARFVLVCFSFQQITGFVSRPVRRSELLGLRRKLVLKTVKRAIFNAWRHLPLKTTCFQRALAAHLMLRRRAVGTTLYYGAVLSPDRGLTGHVWLRDGLEFVVGEEAAKGHRQLACYPDGGCMIK